MTAAVDPLDGPIVAGAARTRRGWLDRLRGLAILLMVLDHVLAVLDPASPVRLTVTRLALPLFGFCMAALWRPGINRRRLGWMLVAVVVEFAALPILGVPVPGVMVGLVAVTVLADRLPVVRAPWLCTVVGVVGWVYWGVGTFSVLAWWGIGRMAPWSELRPYGAALPPFLERVGRHPLGWYVGHLIVLASVVAGATS